MGQPQPCQPGDKILGAALAPAQHIVLVAAMHRDVPALTACPGAGGGVHPSPELRPGAYGDVRVWSSGDTGLGCGHSPALTALPAPRSAA